MASNRKAARMSAEDVRAEACDRLRKAGAADVGPREREHFGMMAHGWRVQWTDGHAVILLPDAGPVRKPLPDHWSDALQLAGDGDRHALQWQPYTGIGKACHVLQAFARGLHVQYARVELEPSQVPTHDGGRVVLHYRDEATTATARAWADATIHTKTGTVEARAEVAQGASAQLQIKYLTALLWADSAEWIVRNVNVGKVPAVAFVAPEVRVLVAEVAR